jgi:hypothetical protein
MLDTLYQKLTSEDLTTLDLKALAHELGVEPAFRMLRCLRGQRIYVPRIKLECLKKVTESNLPNDDMKLVYELCDTQTVIYLLRHYGGTTFIISGYHRDKLVQLINRLKDRGEKVKTIAAAFNISPGMVYKCIKCHKKGQ